MSVLTCVIFFFPLAQEEKCLSKGKMSVCSLLVVWAESAGQNNP